MNIKQWFSDNLSGILIATISVVGSFVGSFAGTRSQVNLWQAEKIFQHNTEIINKRVQTINDILKARVSAQRVYHLTLLDKLITPLTAKKLVQCTVESQDCVEVMKASIESIALKKDIAENQISFFSALNAAELLFCENTHKTIQSLVDTKQDWWDFDTKHWDKLIGAMKTELGCSRQTLTRQHLMF